MRSPLRHTLPLALLLSASVASLASADDPKTALGQWMKKNMGVQMATDSLDFPTLAANFATVAKGAPDPKAYPGWADIANKGGAAAAKNDKDGVKAACKACHTAPSTTGAKNMKEQYRADPGAAKSFP